MLIRDIPKIMITCLTLTLLTEVVGAFLFRVKEKKDYLNVILVNIMTNPLVVIIPLIMSLKYGSLYYYIALGILEIWAVLLEGFLYHKYLCYRKINPFLLSILLNLLSYVIGEIYWRLV